VWPAVVIAEAYDEATAIQRMLDDGAPTPLLHVAHRSPPRPLHLMDEPSAQMRSALRKATRHQYRLYCVACARSGAHASAPPRAQRCPHCGGTMIPELAAD
jgi:hypothetical protein